MSGTPKSPGGAEGAISDPALSLCRHSTNRLSSTRSSDPMGGSNVSCGGARKNGGASKFHGAGLSRGSGVVSRLATGTRFRTRRHSVVRQHGSVGPRLRSRGADDEFAVSWPQTRRKGSTRTPHLRFREKKTRTCARACSCFFAPRLCWWPWWWLVRKTTS